MALKFSASKLALCAQWSYSTLNINSSIIPFQSGLNITWNINVGSLSFDTRSLTVDTLSTCLNSTSLVKDSQYPQMKRGFLKRGFGPGEGSGSPNVKPEPAPPNPKAGATGPTPMLLDEPDMSVEEFMKSNLTQGMEVRISKDSERTKKPETLAFIGFGPPNEWLIILTFQSGREPLRQHPFFDAWLPLPSPYEKVRVEERPGKDKCLIATRDILVEDPIVIERPLLIMPLSLPVLVTYNFDRFVNQMRPPARAALEALHNCKSKGEAMNDTLSKCRTNEFGWQLNFTGESESYAIVYDLPSRANHSCEPNARHDFCYELMCGGLWPIRQIKRGEEITVAYIETDLPRAERQAELKRKYDFECQCGKCLQEDD